MSAAMDKFDEVAGAALLQVTGSDGQRDFDWLLHHGLAALVAHFGARLPVDEVSLIKCTRYAAAWSAQLLLLETAWQDVLEQLAPAPVLVLKGVGLADRLYPQPTLRPVGDLDLLIHPRDCDALMARLQEAGYVPGLSIGSDVFTQQAFSRPLTDAVSCHVDLHWALSNRPLLAQAYAFDELWQASQSDTTGRHVLRDDHDFIHGAIHLLGHHASDLRIKWLLDLHLRWQLASDELREQIIRGAADHGVAPLVATALTICQRHLGTSIPDWVAQLLSAHSQQRSALLLGQGSEILKDLRTLPGARARLHHLRALVLPPPQYMLRRFGPGWLPALHLRRWLHSAGRRFRHGH